MGLIVRAFAYLRLGSLFPRPEHGIGSRDVHRYSGFLISCITRIFLRLSRCNLFPRPEHGIGSGTLRRNSDRSVHRVFHRTGML